MNIEFVRLEAIDAFVDSSGQPIDQAGFLLDVLVDGESARAFIPGSVTTDPLDDLKTWSAFGGVLFQAIDVYVDDMRERREA